LNRKKSPKFKTEQKKETAKKVNKEAMLYYFGSNFCVTNTKEHQNESGFETLRLSYFRSLLNGDENYHSTLVESSRLPGDLIVLHSPTVPDPLVFYLT